MEKEKKARHRHSPSQLAALNELYDKSEHPPLDQRTRLAQRLGMETKTVNAWFQNKRASTKKRSKGDSRTDLPQVSSTSSSVINTPHHAELEDFPDGDYHPFHNACLVVSLDDSPQQPAIYRGVDSQFHTEPDNMPRKIRIRPTAQQTDELKKLYKANPHPSREEREELGKRIGMRYQSITNWFQNQRSLAKKRREETDAAAAPAYKLSRLDHPREQRTFSAFPPPTSHRPIPPSPPPSQLRFGGTRLSSSPTFHVDSNGPVRSLSPSRERHRNAGSLSRTRRTRPEPYQLDALKDLFTRTSNPSIEERCALAHEIGMDVGKVTNWFRNLRQTARKRARKGDGDEPFRSSVSRSGTPSLSSSSSSASSTNEADDLMDLDEDDCYKHVHMGSEDDYQEVGVKSSPPPSHPATMAAVSPHHIRVGHHHHQYEKASSGAGRFSDIKYDDALLLLSFHHHSVQ